MSKILSNISRYTFISPQKPAKNPPVPKITQIFNNNLTIQFQDVNIKFYIKPPYYRFIYPTTLHIKMSKPLTIYCININQLYKKGSKYHIYQFNVNDFKKFVNCQFSLGQILNISNNQQSLKMQLSSNQQIKQYLINKNNTHQDIPINNNKQTQSQFIFPDQINMQSKQTKNISKIEPLKQPEINHIQSILNKKEQQKAQNLKQQQNILNPIDQHKGPNQTQQQSILNPIEQQSTLHTNEQQSILNQKQQQKVPNQTQQQRILNPKEQQSILNANEQQRLLNPKEEQNILNVKEQQSILNTKEQQRILNPKQQQNILNPIEQQNTLNQTQQQNILNQTQQQNILNPKQQQNKQTPLQKQPPKVPNQIPSKQYINITIKSQKSQLSFPMQIQDIVFIQQMAFESLPQIFGLESKFNIQLNSIISKIQNDQIGEEDQVNIDRFIL